MSPRTLWYSSDLRLSMVDTMALLRAFIRTARMVKNTSRLAAGLPADDEVLLDAPDERLAPALVAGGPRGCDHAAQQHAAPPPAPAGGEPPPSAPPRPR
ncbi:hypothetical protein ACFVRU_24450, partial [Streptomyces sp. NPDC057927]